VQLDYHSPMQHLQPLDMTPIPEGRSPLEKAMADRESFMTICEGRLMSLYKELKRDYDRVHGTEKVGDLGKGTQ